jgi:hypothetical protein
LGEAAFLVFKHKYIEAGHVVELITLYIRVFI